MPKATKQKPPAPPPPPGPSEETPEEDLREEETPEGAAEPGGGNGHTEIEEEPATMQVTIKGTAKGVAAAAKKVAGGTPPPRPSVRDEPEEPPPDPLAPLLADPKNMVIVTRKFPRTFMLRSGEKVRCAVKVEKYACPMRRAQIEDDVFDRFGGQSYNVSIHPNTTTGENTILGAFEIEHPNPEEPPYIDDPEGDAMAAAEAAAARIPGGTDPTMRETDSLAKLKQSLEQRLERARMMKEIKDLERVVKEAEEGEEKKAAAPTGPDPKDAEIARLRAELAEKKNDDRFAAMQNSIAQLAQTVNNLANRPPAEHKPSGGEDALVLRILTQSQNHSKEMLDLVKTMNKPAAAPTADATENFDKMLDRFAKMKTAFGGDDSRVSKLQDQLLEMAMERVLGGGDEGGGEEEDTMKFAIKQFTPVLKTYVEKQVEKEEKTGTDGKKQEVSKERLKEIYQQAAEKAAKDLEQKWKSEGWLVRDPKLPGGGQKPGLPAPQKKPQVLQKGAHSGKVVARKETPEGIVEHIQIEPADLSKKTTPKGDTATAEAARQEEAGEVQYTDMPGIGKVEVPAKPGEMKYDRKKAVNYVLNSILSEIAEGTPKKCATDPNVESFVPADALEYLDNELLADVHKVTSGKELDTILGTWGDKEKLDKIKEAGKDEDVDSWLRRSIKTIQDIWRDQQGR